MGLHLGSSQKLKANSNNLAWKFVVPIVAPVVNGIKLISLDNLTLKDIANNYLIAKEDK